MSQEQPWYVNELLEAYKSYDYENASYAIDPLIVNNSGSVIFSVQYPDNVLIGGGYKHVEHYATDDESGLDDRGFGEFKRRLGLNTRDVSVYHSGLAGLRGVYPESVEIFIDKPELTDGEAMMLLCLPLATPERPLEKVLEEVRECARLGICGLANGVTQPKTLVSEEKVTVIDQEGASTISRKDVATLLNIEYVDSRFTADYITQALTARTEVWEFISSFVAYKRAIKDLGNTPANDVWERKALIKKLVGLENRLEARQRVASRSMGLGRVPESSEMGHKFSTRDYEICLVLNDEDYKNAIYTHGFNLVPIDVLDSRLSPQEKAALKIAILPKDYRERRQKEIDRVKRELEVDIDALWI